MTQGAPRSSTSCPLSWVLLPACLFRRVALRATISCAASRHDEPSRKAPRAIALGVRHCQLEKDPCLAGARADNRSALRSARAPCPGRDGIEVPEVTLFLAAMF